MRRTQGANPQPRGARPLVRLTNQNVTLIRFNGGGLGFRPAAKRWDGRTDEPTIESASGSSIRSSRIVGMPETHGPSNPWDHHREVERAGVRDACLHRFLDPPGQSARGDIGSFLAGLVRRDRLLQIFQPELQLCRSRRAVPCADTPPWSPHRAASAAAKPGPQAVRRGRSPPRNDDRRRRVAASISNRLSAFFLSRQFGSLAHHWGTPLASIE
jgi:hypothetical protein